jgi:tetratricopeptide (TPR) repeat protein
MSKSRICLLLSCAISTLPAWSADTLAQAIEYHRQGNCKEAVPLLERLAAREPNNKRYTRMLASCAPSDASRPRGLRDARADAQGVQPKTAAKGRKPVARSKAPAVAPQQSPGSGRSAVKVATAVLTGGDPRKVLQPLPPNLQKRQEQEEQSAPRPSARRAKSKPAVTPATEPAPPPAAEAPTVPPSLESREREQAGSRLFTAEKLIKAKKLAEAAQILEAIISEKPDLTLPRQRLAEIHSARKQFVEAAAQYGWLADHDKGNEFRMRQAQNFSWGERFPESAVSFRQYLEHNPTDAAAQIGLAQVLFWSDRLPEAAEAYTRYLELEPDNAEARLNLGRALLWTGKFDAAHEQFSLAKKKLPNDIGVDLLIARSLEQSSHPDQAMAVYDHALTVEPGNKEALEGRERVAGMVLLKAGYTRQEKNDFKGALEAFTAYLDKFPSEDALLLQVGRLSAWSEDRPRAVRYYESYLERQPNDEAARRELAKVQMSMPDFPGARKSYATLVTGSKPSVEDYEGLVNAHIWDGQFETAQPYVRKLLELDPGNAIGRKAYVAVGDKKREQDLEAAQRLASAGKYKQAIDAYRTFAAEHGATWDVELATARLYGWNRQTPRAVQAYQEYLQRYPNDATARLELADLERWSGRYQPAETGYSEVLKEQPRNSQALFGLAQIADSRGDDRFEVYGAYRRLLMMDPGHQPARQRLGEIMPAVSPSVRFLMNNFHDSDDFGRQVTTAEVGVPFHGGLKLTPLFRHGYYNQFRQVGGRFCDSTAAFAGEDPTAEVQRVSDDICAARGNVQGLGAGAKFEYSPNTFFSVSGEAVAMKMNTPGDRIAMNAFVELVLHPRPDSSLLFSVMRRDAIYDVNTVGSLFAGIVQDGVIVSYEQPLSDRWRLWLSGGIARFSGGTNNAFDNNFQRRFSANADYLVLPWMKAGYFVRVSGFGSFSPLYFSPEFYGTTGFHYGWEKPFARNLRSIGDMELGYGRINRYDMAGVNVAEFSLAAGIAWDIRPDLTLRLGYRYGRGRSSSFGSPVYSTGILDFGMNNYWMPAMPAINPNRIEIR